jgi:sulfite dehydrogenase (quinone) subunit SoeC
MNPAYSVILLTTLTGAGQGLFLALLSTELAGLGEPLFFAIGAAVALVLNALGLLASFFHLGHPERAWRAAAMWRTSWLSREVIALPLFMAGLAAWGAAHFFAWPGTRQLGVLAALMCLALFVCTAMIYASIRFLREWASPLTLINYTLLGCASGSTLATMLAAFLAPSLLPPYAAAAALLTAAGLVTRVVSLRRNARLKPKSTLQTALGIKHPRIEQKSQGFMGGSFNTREFFHGRPALFLRNVKWLFLALAFVLPIAMLAASAASPAWFALAFLVQYVGLLAERWYFFAQANHPQNLYYQVIS